MKMKKGEKSQEKKVKKSIKAKKAPKVEDDLAKMTTEEFFDQDFEGELSDEDDSVQNSAGESDYESDDDMLSAKKHKEDLKNLAKKHPGLYKSLQKDDKDLLDFDLSDDEDISDDDANEDNVHIPNTNLEVASDDSDYEAEEDDEAPVSENAPIKITQKLLKKWEEDLATDKTSTTIKCAVEAFHAALVTVASPDDDSTVLYRVEGSSVFNGVIQLCIFNLPAAFKRFLNIKTDSKFEAHKSKKFFKIKRVLKSYLTDLIKILQSVSSPDILTVLLKHLHQMIPYTQSYSSLNKPLLKILLKFWSSRDENVGVVAFLSIIKIATSHKESILESLLKTMYIKYVENSKFVSQNSLPGINFMRHSLVEIYMLDSNLAYNHAFLYIRQLAIHLRNAMTLKKKENFQAVYNWQYVNSLRFWSELVMQTKQNSMLRTLLYPLVQIITGTINLIPTAQFYPLRFHCSQMLINISKETGVFIPVLPYLLELLKAYDFNKKHKTASMKPISFICLLRMSKAQLQENGFKDEVINNIYQLILEAAANDSSSIYFTDIYVPCVMELKAFLKKCKVGNFARKIKQLLDKIQENRQFIDAERAKIIIDINDIAGITEWQMKIKNEGTPLKKFYDSWFRLHQTQKLKLLTQNDAEGDYKLPSMKKSRKRGGGAPDHDSDLDMPVEEMDKLLKKQAEKKKKKSKKQKLNGGEDIEIPKDNTDIIQDANLHDWD